MFQLLLFYPAHPARPTDTADPTLEGPRSSRGGCRCPNPAVLGQNPLSAGYPMCAPGPAGTGRWAGAPRAQTPTPRGDRDVSPGIPEGKEARREGTKGRRARLEGKEGKGTATSSAGPPQPCGVRALSAPGPPCSGPASGPGPLCLLPPRLPAGSPCSTHRSS